MQIRILIFFSMILGVLCFFTGIDVSAQNGEERFTLVYRNMPLDRALQQLADETGINLVYDSRLTEGLTVNGASRNKFPEEILRDLLIDTRLRYRVTESGAFILFWSARRLQVYGEIRGVITDQETGAPVEGVNVMIRDTNRGAATDQDGFYRITRVAPGQYTLLISHVGYDEKAVNFTILDEQPVRLHRTLEARQVEVERIIITDDLFPLHYMRAGRDIVETEAFLFPLQYGSPDALRNLSFTTGIQFQSPVADVNIQGAYSGNHQVLLDGTPVLNPVSLGRFMSAFSPFAIRRLSVHKAGYRASEGSTTAGVIAAEQDIPLMEEKPYLLQADPTSFNIRVIQEFQPGNHRASIMAAARTNMPWVSDYTGISRMIRDINQPDPILFQRYDRDLEVQTWPENWNHSASVSFTDFHLSSRVQSPDLSQTRLNLYIGSNEYETSLTGTANLTDELRLGEKFWWNNRVSSISHRRIIGDYLRMDISGRVSAHTYRHDYVSTLNRIDPVYAHRSTSEILLTGTDMGINYEINPELDLLGGLEFTFTDVDLGLTDFFHRPVDIETGQTTITNYLELKWESESGYRMIAGYRLTWLSGRGFFAEPRVSFGYDVTESPVGNFSANLGFGLFRDFLQQVDLTNPAPNASIISSRFWIPVNSLTDVPEAWHAAMDLRLEPVRNLVFRFEPYYKWQPVTVVLNYMQDESETGPVSHSDFLIQASSRKAGFGLSAEQRFRQGNLNVLYNFSYVRQRIENRFNGEYIRPWWAEPHQILISAAWNFAPDWQISAQWDYRFGDRSWSMRRSYYDYAAQEPGLPSADALPTGLDSPSSQIRPAYSQVDLGVGWSPEWYGVDWNLRFEIINLFNRRHLLDHGVLPGDTTEPANLVNRYYRTFQPMLIIQAAF